MENKVSQKLPDHKLDVKLIAFDLDDTLLTSELTISPGTVEAIQKAAQNGIYIVLCSGRTENAILPHVRTLEIAGHETGRYLIAMNGSSIYDMHKRQQIFKNGVPGDVLQAVYKECLKNELSAQVYSPDTIFASADNEWTRLDAALCSLQLKVVPDFMHYLAAGHSKMVIPGDPKVLSSFEEHLFDKFSSRAEIFTSKPYFLEIMPKGGGKGEALEILAKQLKINMKNIMAFGDSFNDESMILKAGYGVVMLNGKDDLKEEADFITRYDNENDGIADFLNSFVL